MLVFVLAVAAGLQGLRVPLTLRRATTQNGEPTEPVAVAPEVVVPGVPEAAAEPVVAEVPVVAEEPVVAEVPVVAVVEEPVAMPPKPLVRTGSEWYMLALPWAPRPPYLDGTLAADAGFDPAGFVNSKTELYNYREAEIKHARLAMLGAAGWPVAELYDTSIANLFGLPSIIEQNAGRDPSVLNGGLGLISPVYWAFVVALTGVIELRGEQIKNQKKQADKAWMFTGSWVPGDLGFDPLGLYTALSPNARGKYLMETAELKNGRLAMVAILIFVIEEFFTGKPVVELTPLFFTPFPKVVEQLMFSAPALY